MADVEAMLRLLQAMEKRSAEEAQAVEKRSQEHMKLLMAELTKANKEHTETLRQDAREHTKAIEGLRLGTPKQAEGIQAEPLQQDLCATTGTIRTRDRPSESPAEEGHWWKHILPDLKRASGSVSKACQQISSMLLTSDAQLPKGGGYSERSKSPCKWGLGPLRISPTFAASYAEDGWAKQFAIANSSVAAALGLILSFGLHSLWKRQAAPLVAGGYQPLNI